MWQDNLNIKCAFEIEAIYNPEFNRKTVVKELAQWVKEVTKAIEYIYISNTNERSSRDIQGNLRKP